MATKPSLTATGGTVKPLNNEFDTVKSRINQFLLLHGITPNPQGAINCLWHEDKNPSMSLIGDNYHCFTCEKNADIYTFAAHFYGLDEKRDFLAIKRRVVEELGLTNTVFSVPDAKMTATSKPMPIPIADDALPYIYSDERLKRIGKGVFNVDIAAIDSVYPYRNKQGLIEYVECRYPGGCFGDGKKKVLGIWFDGSKTRAKDCPVRLYNRDKLAAFPDLPVVIHEGAKCAEAAGVISGFVHTAYNGGGKKVHSVDLTPLKGRVVYIYPDDDTDERVGMKTATSLMALLLQEYNTESTIVQPVPEARSVKPSGADIVEALQVKSPDELREWILTKRVDTKARPYFLIDEGYELHEAARTVAGHLIEAGKAIYHKDGIPLEILDEASEKVSKVLSVKELRETISESCSFLYRDKQNPPPIDITETIAARARKYFNELKGVRAYPVVTKTGRTITKSGYDAETKYYYDIPAGIETMSIPEAVRVLDDVVVDFMFATSQDKANFYALLLTPIAQAAIGDLIPPFIATAPSIGTGKTKLMGIALRILTGTAPNAEILSEDEAEVAKNITASFMTGQPYLFFDNIKRLDSPTLAALTTNSRYGGRILGKSQKISCENDKLILFTGNNPKPSPEMTRRLVTINLDANLERPYERDAKGYIHPDIEGYVLKHRAKILSALLSIACNTQRGEWTGKVKGSFFYWSCVIGSALAAAGIEGFTAGTDILPEQIDDNEQALRAFINAWQTRYGSKPMAAKDLIDIAVDAGMVDEDTIKSKKWLSRTIGKNVNRVFNGYKLIVNPDTLHGYKTYCLKPLQTREVEPPQAREM
jgi:hypothetical protein